MNPREFFNEFILPTVDEWRSDPLNVRKAVVAVSQLDIMADQVVVFQNPGLVGDPLRKLQTDVRRKAQKNDQLLLLLCDIHDSHKHGPLARKTATITRGQRPTKTHVGGVFDPAVFDNDTFDVGRRCSK
jgi:hypothetical protein